MIIWIYISQSSNAVLQMLSIDSLWGEEKL
jgi:hypothetical protein